MALSDDIRTLRDRSLAVLNSAHDYDTDTKIAWQLVRQIIADGQTLNIRNATTGTVTTESELSAKARGYVREQLTEATFQQFVSIFEDFYGDILRLWLTTYPRSLGKKTVELKSVLDLPDKDAIVQLVVTKELFEYVWSE